ncbi:MBL fold metallo-hydrolase [Marinicrinis sediminis]|uniref:MBL fold metallo-hydrolase n=1 Tax=Marinicrinis sediminis TaxID=1652465 RepID=A0ABW5RHS5_9BACL
MQPRSIPSDIHYMRAMIVNLLMIGEASQGQWTLIDTGIPGFADRIAHAAKQRFGTEKPSSIILTHGHFDHVGSLKALLTRWEDVPVYAHRLELPFLQGDADYLPADPTVGGGLMAELAPLYPHKGIDLGGRVEALPEDGSVPTLPEWTVIETPGHTDGHIALFRERDRTIIAGDAFITVKQESALAVLLQQEEIHGPPTYFTPNWDAAGDSVRRLAALLPEVAITGHGKPVTGQALIEGLDQLAQHFEEKAIPEHGRYVVQS